MINSWLSSEMTMFFAIIENLNIIIKSLNNLIIFRYFTIIL